MISAGQLQRIMPSATPARIANFIGPLNATMDEFGISTPKRQAAFLAQLAHESGSLRYVEEIASGAAYDNRADLGNTRPDAIALAELAETTPGRYYKGRGLIQITGYDNYLACSRALLRDDSLTKNPAMLERADLACRSAGWYWDSRRLNDYADAGQFETITRKINGGLNGQADRLAHYQRALSVLEGGDSASTESATFPESSTGDQNVAPFVAAAIPSLIQAAPALIRIFGSGEQTEKNAKAAEVAVEIAKAVTEKPTAEGAVAAMQADPELATTYAKAVAAQWYELAGEAGGGGIAGAREADIRVVEKFGGFWRSPSFAALALLLPLAYMIVGSVAGLWGYSAWSDDVRAAISTAVVSLIIGGAAGYYWGAATGSRKAT